MDTPIAGEDERVLIWLFQPLSWKAAREKGLGRAVESAVPVTEVIKGLAPGTSFISLTWELVRNADTSPDILNSRLHLKRCPADSHEY